MSNDLKNLERFEKTFKRRNVEINNWKTFTYTAPKDPGH